MDARLQRQGGVGVPQVMEPDPGQLRRAGRALERPLDALRVQRLAVFAREHVVGLVPSDVSVVLVSQLSLRLAWAKSAADDYAGVVTVPGR